MMPFCDIQYDNGFFSSAYGFGSRSGPVKEQAETFFNLLLIGDCYVAYMEDGKLILQDIFHEDLLYMTVSRDFTQTADPMSAIIAIEMQDEGTVALSYYRGGNYEETSYCKRMPGSDPNPVNWILTKDIEDYLKVPEW